MGERGAERSPEGHPSPVPGSPRSVAEGRIRHDRLAPHSPRSEAEGGTMSSAACPLQQLVMIFLIHCYPVVSLFPPCEQELKSCHRENLSKVGAWQ
jgi:hypothetical protein